MKVLLVNGSPHEKGCTFTALSEAAKTLQEEGISGSERIRLQAVQVVEHVPGLENVFSMIK